MFNTLKPPLGARLITGHPLAQGLVGCWLMNEGSGNKIFDLSGNKNHGDITGEVSWAVGEAGQALKFNDNEGYVNCGSNSSTDILNGNFTLVTWAKLAAKLDDRDIIAKLPAIGASGVELRYDLGDDHWEMNLHDGSWHFAIYGQENPNLNQWYHVVGLRDGSTIKIYVDGVVGDTVDIVGTVTDVSSENWFIGCQGADTDDRPFNGLIGAIMMYNRALLPEEIARLHHEPYAMFRQSDEFWWVAYGTAAGGISIPLVMQSMDHFNGGAIHG